MTAVIPAVAMRYSTGSCNQARLVRTSAPAASRNTTVRRCDVPMSVKGRVIATGVSNEEIDDPASAHARNDSIARPLLATLTARRNSAAPTAVAAASFSAAVRRPATSSATVAAAGP